MFINTITITSYFLLKNKNIKYYNKVFIAKDIFHNSCHLNKPYTLIVYLHPTYFIFFHPKKKKNKQKL